MTKAKVSVRSRRIAIAAFVAMSLRLGSLAAGQASAPASQRAQGKIHTYFIAADEVDWDYTPRGRNLAGLPHPEGADDERGATPHRIYHKAIYREYTDASFKTLKPRAPEWEHLGILGPLIRAEVGDTIRVIFKNNTKLFVTMHPHGLQYTKENEGALYADQAENPIGGNAVRPNETRVYTWSVPESSGPGPMDGNSVLWMYHSHFVESKDMNTGLLGPIIVTARGQSRPDGSPKDVDREFVTAFALFDETDSWFSGLVRGKLAGQLGMRITDPLIREQNTLFSINGLIEGNLPLLTMKRGERVRWYLLSNGNEDDIHAAHWHGQTAIAGHMRTDTVSLGPMSMAIADMVADQPGRWLFHCHVNEHLNQGMVAVFQVVP